MQSPPPDDRPSTPPPDAPPTHIRWEHLCAAILMAVMVVVTFANVLARLFHCSLAFTEEITVNAFVWLTIVGSGLAFERGAHLGMVTIRNRLPRRLRRIIAAFGASLGAALFISVDILLIRTIYYEITIFRATSASLGIPIWIYYAVAVAFSPVVFFGAWRGFRVECSQLDRGD